MDSGLEEIVTTIDLEVTRIVSSYKKTLDNDTLYDLLVECLLIEEFPRSFLSPPIR